MLEATRRLMLFLAIVATPALSAGQAVRVSVRDSVLNAPVAHALITLQQDGVDAVLHGVTNTTGQATISVPTPGRWTVSVRRIGVVSRTATVQTRAGDVAAVIVFTRAAGFTLPAARVIADAGVCSRARASDDRTSALWEQVTLALRTAATAARDPGRATALRAVGYDRELDRSLRLVSERPSTARRGLGRPFSAAHPESLATHGWVRSDADQSLQYFAPDEHALLSTSFARTHCFDTPPVDADPSLAELRFRPAPTQQLPDIAGTAFLDARSGELRRIVFEFVNAGPLFPPGTDHAGGEVKLERLPDGAWIVAGWSIRMPRMVRVAWARAPRLTGYHEVGGDVDTLQTPATTIVSMPLTRLVDAGVPTARPARGRPASTVATGDLVVVGGKLVVAASGQRRSPFDWTPGFAQRRRFGVGVFIDSMTLGRSPAGSALELLPLFSHVELFTVPDGVDAPSRGDDVDLSEGWIAGGALPLMQTVGASDVATRCHVKLFLDGERTSAAALRALPGSTIGGMEFYARPRDVPDGFRRSGNRCGTVVLWSREMSATP